VAAALSGVTAAVRVAGITTDRLYPFPLQEELGRLLPGRPEVVAIDSPAGHDGFLVEVDAVGAVVRGALA
jgi:homoserine O-acetyltransferase